MFWVPCFETRAQSKTERHFSFLNTTKLARCWFDEHGSPCFKLLFMPFFLLTLKIKVTRYSWWVTRSRHYRRRLTCPVLRRRKEILLLPGRGWWCRNFTKWHTLFPSPSQKYHQGGMPWGISKVNHYVHTWPAIYESTQTTVLKRRWRTKFHSNIATRWSTELARKFLLVFL